MIFFFFSPDLQSTKEARKMISFPPSWSDKNQQEPERFHFSNMLIPPTHFLAERTHDRIFCHTGPQAQ